MKLVGMSLVVLSFVFQAEARAPKKENICLKLIKEAEELCDQDMCGDGERECVRDGDYFEGRGICVFDDTLPRLVKEYNRKNPSKKIGCDGEELVQAGADLEFDCQFKKEDGARLKGEVFENAIKATILDPKKSLAEDIREFETREKVEFLKVERKKESQYTFAKFYHDFNAWQDFELSLPKDVLAGKQTGKFSAFFTVSTDTGNFMAPGESKALSCTVK